MLLSIASVFFKVFALNSEIVVKMTFGNSPMDTELAECRLSKHDSFGPFDQVVLPRH